MTPKYYLDRNQDAKTYLTGYLRNKIWTVDTDCTMFHAFDFMTFSWMLHQNQSNR